MTAAVEDAPATEMKGALAEFDSRKAVIAVLDGKASPLIAKGEALELGTPELLVPAKKFRDSQIVPMLAEFRKERTGVDKRREFFVADAVRFQKEVNGAAKFIIGELRSREDQLKAIKDRIDKEEARLKWEAENAERLRLEEESKKRIAEAAEKARKDAEEAAERIRKQQAEEAEKLRQENERIAKEKADLEAAREEMRRKQKEIDDARAAEQSKADAERKAKQDAERAEREKLEAEVKRLKDEKDAAVRAEAARIDNERIQKLAREKFEREQKEAADRDAAEKARIERERPEAERIRAFGDRLQELILDAPELSERAPADFLSNAVDALQSIALSLKAFGGQS